MEIIDIDYMTYCDRIILDTSALMEIKALKAFLKKYREVMPLGTKNLYILDVVWMELVKHLNSSNQRNASIASAAISVVNDNRDVINVNDRGIEYGDVNVAFADPIILADIQINKGNGTQLLITNDFGLARDAQRLNVQKSCLGYPVFTYRISKAGNLLEHNNEFFGDIDARTIQSMGVSTLHDDIQVNSNQHNNNAVTHETNVNNVESPGNDNRCIDENRESKKGLLNWLPTIVLGITTGVLIWEKYSRSR